jgi:hypothetical protein
MKISQLQEPYKTLAKFFMKKSGVKSNELADFGWINCTGRLIDTHWKFWNGVEQGQKPKIPKSIITYYEKHSGKKLPVVMGMPKNFSEKTKLIPVKKVKPTESYDHLLDKKMKGFDFKFDTANTSLPYVLDMDYYIGKIGTITAVFGDIVEVMFDSLTWMYPSHLAKDHLVEDLNGIPFETLNAEPGESVRTKDQIIAALEKDLDDAYKNEEAMLKELNTNLDRIIFHCHSVKENTGNITIDDITYCTILVRRVMENKFAYKPKEEF